MWIVGGMINRRHLLALGAATALTPAFARADDWDSGFDAFVNNGLTATHTPGLSVGIAAKGRVFMARGYGLADIAANRPVTADTAFHIASVSKTVTGTALMMLYQDGRFQLDDPIAKYLDFKVAHPKFPDTPITFRHLMTHTSGIADTVYDTTDAFAVSGDPTLPLGDFLAGYLTPGGQWYSVDDCYGAQPGTAWAYSNVAIALLGYLAGRLGTDLKTLTQDRLFTPLGLTHTSWTYAGLKPEDVATPYDVSDGTPKALPPTGYPDWPAGLLRTSANDFARFLALYTAQGTVNGHTYLKPETLKTMLTPGTVLPDPAHPDIRQALVWQVRDLGPYHVASHGGGDPGALTVAAIDTEAQIAVLVFANASGSPEFREFQKEMVSRLLARAKDMIS